MNFKKGIEAMSQFSIKLASKYAVEFLKAV